MCCIWFDPDEHAQGSRIANRNFEIKVFEMQTNPKRVNIDINQRNRYSFYIGLKMMQNIESSFLQQLSQ